VFSVLAGLDKGVKRLFAVNMNPGDPALGFVIVVGGPWRS